MEATTGGVELCFELSLVFLSPSPEGPLRNGGTASAISLIGVRSGDKLLLASLSLNPQNPSKNGGRPSAKNTSAAGTNILTRKLRLGTSKMSSSTVKRLCAITCSARCYSLLSQLR